MLNQKLIEGVQSKLLATQPLRNPDAVFPNNRRMAELRLKNLKKRFMKDKQYHKDYTSFMEDMIKKDYRVSNS